MKSYNDPAAFYIALKLLIQILQYFLFGRLNKEKKRKSILLVFSFKTFSYYHFYEKKQTMRLWSHAQKIFTCGNRISNISTCVPWLPAPPLPLPETGTAAAAAAASVPDDPAADPEAPPAPPLSGMRGSMDSTEAELRQGSSSLGTRNTEAIEGVVFFGLE